MLRLSSNRDHLKIVSDQWGGPTSARSIAHMAMNIITKAGTGPDQKGIFHFSGASDTTWADFAEAVFNAAKRSMTVEKIKTSEYPTPARRPLNSRLDCSRILESFGIERSDWRSDMMDVMKDLKGVDW
jgi:dTDP-4-dehydrorhamnose reductase